MAQTTTETTPDALQEELMASEMRRAKNTDRERSQEAIKRQVGAPLREVPAFAEAETFLEREQGRQGEKKESDKKTKEKEGKTGALKIIGQLRKEKLARKNILAKFEEKVGMPARMATGQALKASWLGLIESFGLTLIYINLHVFMRQLFPSFFCRLGEEWIPKQVRAAGGEAGESVGRGIGIFEIVALIALDLLVLLIIVILIVFIALIVDFMQAGFIEKVKILIGGLTGLSWGAIKALMELF